VSEIWRGGGYNDEVVAIKILKVPGDDNTRKTKSRFCKEVALMKQVKHDNILPFYGVSTTISDFCLVFPWYENGSIMKYLEKKPDTNRFDLLLAANNGLRFLHDNRLVHGALKPSHILIDDRGTARLATAGRSSIVAVPGTSIADHKQSEGGTDSYRYSAPEVQWPEDHGNDKVLITKGSDVYGMGMVAYEVLTGNVPYFGRNDRDVLVIVQGGENPQRPAKGIDDQVWVLLEKCWNRDPATRPTTIEVNNTLSEFSSSPCVILAPEGRPATEGLPEKLKLQIRSIKIPLKKSKPQQFSIKFRYGNGSHTTSPATKVVGDSGEYTWNDLENPFIGINKQHRAESVSFEVFRRTSGMFRREKACATGDFSLLNNVNKETSVELKAPKSVGPAVLKILLTET